MENMCIAFSRKDLKQKTKVKIYLTEADKCFLKLDRQTKYLTADGTLSDTKHIVDCQINEDGSISFPMPEGLLASGKDGRAEFSSLQKKTTKYQLAK